MKHLTKNKLKTAFSFIANGGFTAAVCNLFLGRCTFAAIVLGTVGIYGFLHGKDLTSYSMFMTALLSFLVVHSTKEDYFQKQSQQQNTQVVNNITVDPNTQAKQ